MRCVAPAVALSLAALACTHPRVDFRDTPRTYQAKDYYQVQERWTRAGSLYRELASVYFLFATLKSWDFRQAYMARYARHFALTQAEQAAHLARQREAHASAYELFVSLAMNQTKWNDLERHDSLWHLTLLNEKGEEVHPMKVVHVRKSTPEIFEFYPFHTAFAKAYRVRFPKTLPDGRPLLGAGRKLVLRLAGAPGKADLVWESRE